MRSRSLPTLQRALMVAGLCAALAAGPSPAGAARDISGGIVRGDLGPAAPGGALTAARAALAANAGRLGVRASDFTFESVRRSIIGLHVRGREQRFGVPVEGTSTAVHILNGRVALVEARGSSLAGRPGATSIARAAAVTAALAGTGVSSPIAAPATERLLAAHGDRLADVWRVSIASFNPPVMAEVDVAAADGRLLAVRDSRQRLDGQATVFDPSATVVMRDAAYREPGVDEAGVDTDLDSPELTRALSLLPIKQVDQPQLAAGRLVGPYVEVQGPAPLDIANGAFLYTRGDPRFETTMAYAHLDRVQRYFQTLGFTGPAAINAEPQNVFTLPVVGFDNSFYQPGNDLILYGAGGVDDAEDAEVVLHEYGHAVQDAQVPGWGSSHEGGSMGEGFGDFLAATYYAGSISKGFGDACVADWDATSYSSANPPCLRRTDVAKKYPGGMQGEVHADGEIWSSFLWDLRTALRCPAEPPEDDPNWDTDPECREPRSDSQIMSDRALKLLLTSHELLSSNADFGDSVAALRTATVALGRPDWDPLVVAMAQKRGLPLS